MNGNISNLPTGHFTHLPYIPCHLCDFFRFSLEHPASEVYRQTDVNLIWPWEWPSQSWLIQAFFIFSIDRELILILKVKIFWNSISGGGIGVYCVQIMQKVIRRRNLWHSAKFCGERFCKILNWSLDWSVLYANTI